MPFVVMIYATTPQDARNIRERYQDSDVGRAVGIYAIPKANTEPTCPGYCKDGGGAWTRHPHRGNIVHACGKRKRGWRRSIGKTLFDMFGLNLMHRDDTPAMFRNPEGWGS